MRKASSCCCLLTGVVVAASFAVGCAAEVGGESDVETTSRRAHGRPVVPGLVLERRHPRQREQPDRRRRRDDRRALQRGRRRAGALDAAVVRAGAARDRGHRRRRRRRRGPQRDRARDDEAASAAAAHGRRRRRAIRCRRGSGTWTRSARRRRASITHGQEVGDRRPVRLGRRHHAPRSGGPGQGVRQRVVPRAASPTRRRRSGRTTSSATARSRPAWSPPRRTASASSASRRASRWRWSRSPSTTSTIRTSARCSPDAFVCAIDWAIAHNWDLINASLTIDPFTAPNDDTFCSDQPDRAADREDRAARGPGGGAQQDHAGRGDRQLRSPTSPTWTRSRRHQLQAAPGAAPARHRRQRGRRHAKLAFYSNYGFGAVDLTAPGGDGLIPNPADHRHDRVGPGAVRGAAREPLLPVRRRLGRPGPGLHVGHVPDLRLPAGDVGRRAARHRRRRAADQPLRQADARAAAGQDEPRRDAAARARPAPTIRAAPASPPPAAGRPSTTTSTARARSTRWPRSADPSRGASLVQVQRRREAAEQRLHVMAGALHGGACRSARHR